MNRNSYWSQIVGLIVSLVFCYFGIQILLSGNIAFAIIWLLINGTQTVRIIRQLINSIRYGIVDQRVNEVFDDAEDIDVYGHRTHASYEKERLRKVEELYRDGLLTKDEYEEKRSEIIDNL